MGICPWLALTTHLATTAGSAPPQIGHRAVGVVGLTRPFVPYVAHQAGVVACT
jgi:hypothetical protein